MGRNRALGGGVEQPFALELCFEPQEALIQRTEPRLPHPFDVELEAPARLVQGHERADFDAHPFAGSPIQQRGAAAEHHAVDLRLLVLEHEVQVARSRRRDVADLARHPQQREAPLDQVAGAAQQPRDADDVFAGRIFRGQIEFHAAAVRGGARLL